MLIHFIKGSSERSSVLRCARADGTFTWTKIQPAIEFHDLAHYVVESQLKFTEGFYGLIAKGYNIEDFELPREVRPESLLPANLPIQALQTEHIVNLLQVYSGTGANTFDFLETLESVLKEKQLPCPEELNDLTLTKIILLLDSLLNTWEQLGPEETLELEFSL